MLLAYAWVAYQEDKECLAALLLAGCAGLFLLCVFLFRYARMNLERMTFEAVAVEAADRENIAFLLFYLLPLFTDDIASFNWQV